MIVSEKQLHKMIFYLQMYGRESISSLSEYGKQKLADLLTEITMQQSEELKEIREL